MVLWTGGGRNGAAWSFRRKAAPGFENSGNPSLVISTIEALVVLMGRKLFFGGCHAEQRIRVQVAQRGRTTEGTARTGQIDDQVPF